MGSNHSSGSFEPAYVPHIRALAISHFRLQKYKLFFTYKEKKMAIIWNKKMFRPYPVLPLQGSTFTSECRKYRIGEGRDLWRRVPKHFKRLSYLEGNSTRTTLWWVGMYTLFQSADPWPRRRVTQQPKRRYKITKYFPYTKKKHTINLFSAPDTARLKRPAAATPPATAARTGQSAAAWATLSTH